MSDTTDPQEPKIMIARGTFPVPTRKLPDELRIGTYANNIDSLQTQNDLLLDFSVIYPVPVEGTPEQPSNAVIEQEVVARIIVPAAVMETFVENFVSTRPSLIERISKKAAELAEGTNDENA